jgi:von Willebrand factor type A domain/Aerotolerance regulator N-terminal
MPFGVLNAVMLAGLAGVSIPVIIHFLNRRRDLIIDWGAMQFLDPGRKARRKIQLTELLLMLARMGLLAAAALALARPYWGGASTTASAGATLGGPARDLVLVFDGSVGMNRKAGETTTRADAIRAARALVDKLAPGDSAAVLLAGDRVRTVLAPSFDLKAVDAALAALEPKTGRPNAFRSVSSDIPAGLMEAFRVLERTQNPAREIVVLTDGRRAAWKPGETGRWVLLRDLHKRLPSAPRIWSLAFGKEAAADVPNGSIAALSVSRGLVTPGLPLTLTAEVRNDGPGPLTTAAELWIDGKAAPGTAQPVGPIPEGGRAPVRIKTSLPIAGSHLLSLRLVSGADALAEDDEASVAVDAAEALPVLLIDGEPGREPFRGEVDFLRAALSPSGDDSPQVKTTVLTPDHFKPVSLEGQSVLVLANVERLDLNQGGAVSRFLEAGGGVLVAPGDRVDLAYFNNVAWMPATLGPRKGDYLARKSVAHPSPSTFAGPVLPTFGQGDAPPLREASLFGYFPLTARDGSSVSARLDTGDPWVVERPQGKGRVLLVAGPLDAEGGTLPVNPEFVPLTHEWMFHLAGGAEPRVVKPGEALVFPLHPTPPEGVTFLPITTPGGQTARAPVTRTVGTARARFEDTAEAGVYRLTRPDGTIAYATVQPDDRISAPEPLPPEEAVKLAEGWPLRFERDTQHLATDLLSTGESPRRELWRFLVLAALAGLCVEIYLTRKLARGQAGM